MVFADHEREIRLCLSKSVDFLNTYAQSSYVKLTWLCESASINCPNKDFHHLPEHTIDYMLQIITV